MGVHRACLCWKRHEECEVYVYVCNPHEDEREKIHVFLSIHILKVLQVHRYRYYEFESTCTGMYVKLHVVPVQSGVVHV